MHVLPVTLTLATLSLLASSCSRQETSPPADTKQAAKNVASTPVQSARVTEIPVQTAETEAAPEKAESGDRKYVRVSTLNGIEGNSEFQRNLEIIQNQQQLVSTLFGQIELATAVTTRDALQKQYEDALERLKKNNQTMLEAYGFSLTRNYVRVVEKSHVYMSVNAAEAAKYEESRKAKEAEAAAPAPVPRIE